MAANSSADLERILKAHLDSDTKRLDRIEAKIDKLSETVVALARVEEKVTALEKETERINERLSTIDNRLEAVESKAGNNDVTVKVVNKVFWLLLTTAVGALAAYILH